MTPGEQRAAIAEARSLEELRAAGDDIIASCWDHGYTSDTHGANLRVLLTKTWHVAGARAGEPQALDQRLRFLLGGHAAGLPAEELDALGVLRETIGKVLAEARPAVERCSVHGEPVGDGRACIACDGGVY